MSETQRRDAALPAVTTAHDRGAQTSAATDAPSGAVAVTDQRGAAGHGSRHRAVRTSRRARGAVAGALLDLAGGVLGALPVLWVLGAVPWRQPTLLIDVMFSGFARCALDGGALNPLVMWCPRVGAPLGMYQLDGALSYPLGGVLMRLGVAPLTAWKTSVALLVIAGFAALFHVGRRATGSVPVAVALVVISGLSGTLTARSWNWYWNITATVLLALVFAALFVVLERARSRSVARIVPAGAAVVGSVLLVALEWSYAGMFATAVALVGVVVLVLQRGWGVWRRLLLAAGGVAAALGVFLVQRGRLDIAGVSDQFNLAFQTATNHSVDVASMVVPDAEHSYLGLLLRGLGLQDVLVRTLSEGDHLWVVPYLGVLTVTVLAGAYVWRHGRLEPSHHRPPGLLLLLIVVTLLATVASLGPVVRIARLALPEASFVAWLSPLWADSPMRWIRYPWTWGFLTTIATLLTVAVLTPALFHRRGSWSPLVWGLAAIVVLEFASPQVLDAADSARPSVPTASSDNVVSRDHPAIERFEDEQLSELHRALADRSGSVTMFPWGNTWTAPYLAGADGAVLRNVGIDRNVRRVRSLTPPDVTGLGAVSAETVERVLDSGWSDAVVLLDFMPDAGAIIVHDHGHLGGGQSRWLRRKGRIEDTMLLAGACVEPHSWFTVITSCSAQGPLASAGISRAW